MGDHVGFERQFVDVHLRACIYAGVGMYGYVRESIPSQVLEHAFDMYHKFFQ